ncbi:MAG: hypothetical protein CBB80_004705 [Synechococcus sp. TMED20]|nr:MAG: hypothetical protein CBB80_004705 [Synechococcus sp. TMED20]
MSPLFACHRCGMQIERSMANYWRLKGRVICSGCLDLQAVEDGQDADDHDAGPAGQDRASKTAQRK